MWRYHERHINSNVSKFIIHTSTHTSTHIAMQHTCPIVIRKALHFSIALWGYLCNKTSHTITMTLSFWVLLSPWCFIPWLPISKFEAILLATSVSRQNTQWRVVQVSLVFPCFPQDVLKLWHIKSSPKAGSSTFASKSTMASLKVLIFSDSGGTWLEGNPCHAALKSSAPNKPLKNILSSRHCFGTVVGRGAPQEWCSQTPFLWAEKMVFVSPAGEGCCWSLKAPNAQKAGWKFEVYLLHLITPKQQSTQQSPSGTWSLWFNLQTCGSFFFTGLRRKH